MPKTDTKDRIIHYLNHHGETTPHELVRFLEISSQALFRHLKTLIQNNSIEKIGAPPKVYYRISTKKQFKSNDSISKINTSFLLVLLEIAIMDLRPYLFGVKDKIFLLKKPLKNIKKR
jgi:predicted ArsR family transcriptional regulator